MEQACEGAAGSRPVEEAEAEAAVEAAEEEPEEELDLGAAAECSELPPEDAEDEDAFAAWAGSGAEGAASPAEVAVLEVADSEPEGAAAGEAPADGGLLFDEGAPEGEAEPSVPAAGQRAERLRALLAGGACERLGLGYEDLLAELAAAAHQAEAEPGERGDEPDAHGDEACEAAGLGEPAEVPPAEPAAAGARERRSPPSSPGADERAPPEHGEAAGEAGGGGAQAPGALYRSPGAPLRLLRAYAREGRWVGAVGGRIAFEDDLVAYPAGTPTALRERPAAAGDEGGGPLSLASAWLALALQGQYEPPPAQQALQALGASRVAAPQVPELLSYLRGERDSCSLLQPHGQAPPAPPEPEALPEALPAPGGAGGRPRRPLGPAALRGGSPPGPAAFQKRSWAERLEELRRDVTAQRAPLPPDPFGREHALLAAKAKSKAGFRVPGADGRGGAPGRPPADHRRPCAALARPRSAPRGGGGRPRGEADEVPRRGAAAAPRPLRAAAAAATRRAVRAEATARVLRSEEELLSGQLEKLGSLIRSVSRELDVAQADAKRWRARNGPLLPFLPDARALVSESPPPKRPHVASGLRAPAVE